MAKHGLIVLHICWNRQTRSTVTSSTSKECYASYLNLLIFGGISHQQETRKHWWNELVKHCSMQSPLQQNLMLSIFFIKLTIWQCQAALETRWPHVITRIGTPCVKVTVTGIPCTEKLIAQSFYCLLHKDTLTALGTGIALLLLNCSLHAIEIREQTCLSQSHTVILNGHAFHQQHCSWIG